MQPIRELVLGEAGSRRESPIADCAEDGVVSAGDERGTWNQPIHAVDPTSFQIRLAGAVRAANGESSRSLTVVFGVAHTACENQASPECEAPPEGRMSENIRVLLAKVGLDGHDRGVKVVARCLRDAGMDVVYTGLHRSPEEVVDAAVQEDVDVLGVSLLSGAHMTIFPRIIKRLREKGVDDMILLGGGVIPDDDVVALKKMGVAEVLLQDTPPDMIVNTVRTLVRERGAR
jgi:methylmalonyl-CoA mutase C-terminal domain/subunit